MRVLDLDMDAFLLKVRHFVEPGVRPSRGEAPPWPANEVIEFLETKCGLSSDEPIEGVLVDEHDEVLDVWLSEIGMGRLVAPLEVVHVDAHADMGLGSAGWRYLLTELLHQPVEQRPLHIRPESRTGVAPGNYLAYAIACRLISTLDYAYPPAGGDDELDYFFRRHSRSSGYIELPCYPVGTPEAVVASPLRRPKTVEPAVQYRSTPMRDYVSRVPFDRVYVSRSPDYVSVEAENLISDVLIEYVQF